MFATLLGPLPRPPLADEATAESLIDAVLEVQVAHGLEPLTTAGWDRWRDDPVGSWRDAAERQPSRLVKAVVAGPVSSGLPAASVRALLDGLVGSGCAWIEIHEPAASTIDDDAGRIRFAEIQRSLTAGMDGVHLSLAVIGGSAEALGIDALLAGAYSSLAFDLSDGPDNWRLVSAAPTSLGIVAGAVSTRPDSDDGPELRLWAAGYAASTAGRGVDRVGLATAGSLAHLTWDAAVAKVAALGEAARLAGASRDDVIQAVDPRALDSRSAALGRHSKPPPRRPTTIDP